MPSGLETGFLLDRQWHWMRSGMEQTKEPALLALGKILAEKDVPYALIDGLAFQIHQAEPRTTLDIDLADAQSLLEATPELAGEMTPEEKAALDRLRL